MWAFRFEATWCVIVVVIEGASHNQFGAKPAALLKPKYWAIFDTD